MSDKNEPMARIHVSCDVDIPAAIARQCTDDQIEEWVRFNLNENGIMHKSPIQNLCFEGVAFSAEFRWIKKPEKEVMPIANPA